MSTDRTPLLRFARELSDQTEWFTARWLAEGPPPAKVEHYFPNAARLKHWLVAEQKYSEDQAEALVVQLRTSHDTTP